MLCISGRGSLKTPIMVEATPHIEKTFVSAKDLLQDSFELALRIHFWAFGAAARLSALLCRKFSKRWTVRQIILPFGHLVTARARQVLMAMRCCQRFKSWAFSMLLIWSTPRTAFSSLTIFLIAAAVLMPSCGSFVRGAAKIHPKTFVLPRFIISPSAT